MTGVSADEALPWLRAYHAETLRLALEVADAAERWAQASLDLHAVPEGVGLDRSMQRDRMSALGVRFANLLKQLRARVVEHGV